MGQNNLGRHSPENETGSQTEENEVIVSEQGGIWGEKPCAAAGSEGNHGGPFQEDWEDREAITAARSNYVHNTTMISTELN